jgi:hypothetical protein
VDRQLETLSLLWGGGASQETQGNTVSWRVYILLSQLEWWEKEPASNAGKRTWQENGQRQEPARPVWQPQKVRW